MLYKHLRTNGRGPDFTPHLLSRPLLVSCSLLILFVLCWTTSFFVGSLCSPYLGYTMTTILLGSIILMFLSFVMVVLLGTFTWDNKLTNFGVILILNFILIALITNIGVIIGEFYSQ